MRLRSHLMYDKVTDNLLRRSPVSDEKAQVGYAEQGNAGEINPHANLSAK